MGFPSFPQNTSWQRMKGNATFRIPSFASVTRMPPTTPEHSQLEQRVCVCVCACVCPTTVVYPATRSPIKHKNKAARLRCERKPYTSSTAAWHPSSSSSSSSSTSSSSSSSSSSPQLCLCSFHSVCSLLAGRSRFTLAPHTISLARRLGEEHSRPEARASPNSSHNIAAITTSNHTDRRTEILSSESHSWIFVFPVFLFFFLSPFFHQLYLSCFFLSSFLSFLHALYPIVHYWFLSVVRYMSINRQI